MAYSAAAAAERLLPGHIHRVAGADADWAALAAELDAPSPPPIAPRAAPPPSAPPSPAVPTRPTAPASSATTAPAPAPRRAVGAAERIGALRSADTVDMGALKKIAWPGLPHEVRPDVWRLLLDYMPSSSARRAETLSRKRQVYRDAVQQHYASESAAGGAHVEDATMRQISVDLPRTSPGLALFHVAEVQAALERVLYVWATRHPSSGYVQGMNDLVTPFFFVFLSEFAEDVGMDMLRWTSLEGKLPGGVEDAVACAEADSYWCLTGLLSDIQDYYTFAQPGIQRRVHYLRDLVGRVDAPLCAHLEAEGVDFIQFAFRWMNCMLMREMPFPLIVRVWDTYLAEPDGFALFHVYVCAALLVWFSDQLQELEFQDLVMFLQNLPTGEWTQKEVDVILSQAYMWRTIFGAAPSHLQQS
jgi:TBC1 domain family member 2